MSSTSSATLAQTDVSTATKPASKSTGANKRRRPTFRPASQRKAPGTNTRPTPSATTVAIPSRRVETKSAESLSEQATISDAAAIINDGIPSTTVLSPASTKAPRRAGKKRKVSTGVAIGSSRPLREQQEAAPEEGTVASQPSIVNEPSVPSALPGQVTLQAYCSKYRSKEKRQKQTAQPAPAPEPDEPPAEATAPTSGPVVQVVNGEIVLQESSMVVPGARRSVQEVEEEFQHVVEEENHTAVVGASYNSFVSRRKPQHWTVEETRLFYDALRQVGADFGTMEAYFDTRTRKQLKRKFQVESKQRPHLIAMALSPKSQVPLDMTVFNVQVEPKSSTTQAENSESLSQTNLSPPSPSLPLPASSPSPPSPSPSAPAPPSPSSPAAPSPSPPAPSPPAIAPPTPSPPPSPSAAAPSPPPSPPSVLPTEIAREENESAESFAEPVVEETIFDEQESHVDSETQVSVAIPPVAPVRISSTKRKKRPKFKASKSKARAK